MPEATLARLAELVGGQVVGNADTKINNALPLQDAQPDCLTLADHAKHASRVASSAAAAVLVAEELVDCPKPMLVCRDVHEAFQHVIGFFRTKHRLEQVGVCASAVVDPTASVGSDATMGENVSIGAECRIGKRCTIHQGVQIMPGCEIGDDCILHPNVVLYEGTRIGTRVLIQAGTVLGAYGFGYRQVEGQHVRSAQLGWVEVGDDVEIGASTTIDRGTYGATKIGAGTKIDNLVQIGHNCHIGEHNLICAQVGIAGSSSTGNHVILAGQVGVADHVHLKDKVVACAQSGVMSETSEGQILLGSPAAVRQQRMREYAATAKLPELRREFRLMRQQIRNLTEQMAALESLRGDQRDAA